MTTTPTSLDELTAVNMCLSTIGEARVNTLSGPQVGDVSEARVTILEVSGEIQAAGWHFNREEDVQFALDIGGEIQIPTNVARFDVNNTAKHIIQRGTREYNKTDRTLIFPSALKATVVYYLPFDELPTSARTYIALRAARRFANRQITSPEIEKFSSRDEFEARALFLDENEENADRTLLDNWTVGMVVSDRATRRTS